LLESFDGIDVVADAASGDEAVIKARQHLPDAILLDLSMPGRSGFETLDELRKVVPDCPS
jgi:DNA-binding NarL/FixJ family response regulator